MQDQVIAVDSDWLPDSDVVYVLLLAIFIGIWLWVALRESGPVNGGAVERTERIPQLYAYSVCLIAVIVALMSVNTIVEKIFALRDPLVASTTNYPFAGGAALGSFDAYKATYDRSTFRSPRDRPDTLPKPSDAELRAQYDALRADQIARASLDARRELTKSAILLLFAIGLFWWHWRWVRAR